MSSIVLAVGNGKTLFGGAGVAPDADLVRFVDPESPIINAFDLCALRGDGIFEATTVWKGFPVSLENHLKRLANSAPPGGHARAEHSRAHPRGPAGHRPV